MPSPPGRANPEESRRRLRRLVNEIGQEEHLIPSSKMVPGRPGRPDSEVLSNLDTIRTGPYLAVYRGKPAASEVSETSLAEGAAEAGGEFLSRNNRFRSMTDPAATAIRTNRRRLEEVE